MTPKTVFADTAYYLASLRVDDPAHAQAVYMTMLPYNIVTTEFIIVELGNACARVPDLSDFLALVEAVRSTPRVTLIPLDSDLLERGLSRMAGRKDKSWSLTDCISFVVMEDMGIREALTTDRHFEQAGFRALLREE